MSTAQALSEGAARQSADLKIEVGERLVAVAREWTTDQRRRFRKALDRAANMLEQEAPAILGFSPEGHPFAGLYSTIGRGNLLVVIAGPKHALALGMRMAEIEEVLAAARMFQEIDGGPRLPVPLLIDHILAKADAVRRGGLSDAALGLLLDVEPANLRYLRTISAAGAVPALICLLSTKGKDGRMTSMRIVLPHGVAWTGLEIAEPEGRA
jgi:hypothetical protein